MIDLIQLYEGYAKILLLIVIFVMAIPKLRRQNYSTEGIVYIFFLLCSVIGNLYWQMNYALYGQDKFFFLSAEDFAFYGIMLLLSVLLEMDNGEYVSGKVAVGTALFHLVMGGLYYGYGDSAAEVVLSISVMGLLCARVLQGCLNRKVFRESVWRVIPVTAILVCLLETSLFFTDGLWYQIANITSYLIRGAVFLGLSWKILKEGREDTDSLLTLSVGGFLLGVYCAYLSEGTVYAIYDIMQAVMYYPMMKAVFRERRAL